MSEKLTWDDISPLLDALNLTVNQTAEAMQCSRMMLNNYKNGKANIPDVMAERLYDYAQEHCSKVSEAFGLRGYSKPDFLKAAFKRIKSS